MTEQLALFRICSIEGCHKPVKARGWCSMHYAQWYKRNPADVTRYVKHAILVTEDDDACWGFQGATTVAGYGFFSVNGRHVLAHRLSYEQWVGPIPDGIEIDHRCRNRSCTNPRHLRLATRKQQMENQARASAQPNSISGIRGVSWYGRSRKWVAQVTHHGKEFSFGYFDTIAEAEAAVIAGRNALYTHNDADRS